MLLAARQPHQEGVALGWGQAGNGLFRRDAGRLTALWAGLGCGVEEVLVQLEELDEAGQGRRKLAQAGRDGRLELVIVGVLKLGGAQPGQVQRPVVPLQQVVAQPAQRGEPAFTLDPLAPLLFVQRDVQDQALADRLQLEAIIPKIRLDRLAVKQALGEAERQPLAAPVGQVQEGIEVARQHLPGVMFEVAPTVRDDRLRRRDVNVAGQLVHRRLLFGRERPVNGLPFVVLVLAHWCDPPSTVPTVRPV